MIKLEVKSKQEKQSYVLNLMKSFKTLPPKQPSSIKKKGLSQEDSAILIFHFFLIYYIDLFAVISF